MTKQIPDELIAGLLARALRVEVIATTEPGYVSALRWAIYKYARKRGIRVSVGLEGESLRIARKREISVEIKEIR